MKQNYACTSATSTTRGVVIRGGTSRSLKHASARLLAVAGTVLGLLLNSLGTQAQQRAGRVLFHEDAPARAAAVASPLAAVLPHARPLTLDTPGLQALLATAPLESRPGAVPVELTLPLPDGSSARFRIVESPIMEPGLAAQFPNIKTYAGVGLDDPSATVRLDMTPRGFHAQILSSTAGTVYIDPVSSTDLQHCLSFWRRDMPLTGQFSCGVSTPSTSASAGHTAQRTIGTTLRTYRLAVAATGEYTATKGGTVAGGQAGIVTSINRVTGVFEKELAVRLVLVANNASLVYTNATTDPYTNNDGAAMLPQNQTTVDLVIGSANYDIGHVFSTGGGGIASLGVVCNTLYKAQGVTGLTSPVGDAFDIDYVAHEMGHQFGANHTFNSISGGCSGNRRAIAAYEPGSGSTIMSYSGLCAPDDTQNSSDAYYHVASYEEIQTYLNTTSCAVTTATNNAAPTVVLPASNKVLPISTPFKLTAVGSDADGDAITYCWEQFDLGPGGALTAPQVDNVTTPLFRSFAPTSNPTRYFPRLTNLVANTASLGELLPTVTRALTFRVTLRDQHNGIAGVVGGVNSSSNVTLSSTSTAGPFLVTAPNAATTWAGGSSQTVTWNVAGTTGNGVNCATVNIRLSTDGGLTYPTLVLAGTPNDGSQAITVPSVATTTARIMVEAADNYFFDISNANFTITAGIACGVATNLSAGNITTTSARISFTPGGSATSYTVTTTPATTTQTVTASPVNLTGLVTGTSYTVNIVSNCSSGATSPAATTSFTTAAQPVCIAVTNAAVGSITTTSASVSFTGSAGASNYTVTTSPATTTQTVTASPVTLTGLTVGTAYTVNIITNCSNGGTATSNVAFATPPTNDECTGAVALVSAISCAPTSGTVAGATQSQGPATCNQATSASALDVWYTFTANGPRHTISVVSNFDVVVEVFSGSCNSLNSIICRDATGANNETLALTTLTAGTVYWVRVYPYDTAPANGNFTICVTEPACGAITDLMASNITSNSVDVSFTASPTATSYTVTTNPATTTQTVSASPVSVTGLAASTRYNVRIVSNCAGGATSLPVIPNISITTAAPTCDAPTNVAAGNITSTSADVAFTAGAGNTSYTATATPQGGGTAVTATGTATPLSLTGLAPNTGYSLIFQAVCAAGGTTGAVVIAFTTPLPPATVTGISKLAPTAAQSAGGTATAQVSFTVTFSSPVSGVSASNFGLSPTIVGAGIASVSPATGASATYTVVVNTGAGNGTLQLNVTNATGITSTVTNTPFSGASAAYTITKSFAAQPQLTIVGTGGTGGDVTAFVDVVQVLSGGTPFANGLQNGSFETHNALSNGSYGYNPTGASWTFNARSGIANGGSAFTPIVPIPSGIAVGVVQSQGGTNGLLQQNLALPTGSSYQVSFQTSQRNCCNSSYDQALNVLLDGVFIGTIQPPANNAYSTFASATFSVTAPALTATLSSSAGASGSTTSTTPIPFAVSFSAAVTGFVAADVSVTNGTVTGGTVNGSGTTYTFTVTPAGNGLVTVSVPANVAADANNTGNTAASPYSFSYAQPVTAAPVLTAPADGSFVNTTTPAYTGTAPANSTVRVYVDGALLPSTATASASGNWTLTQPTALAQGSHTVQATAQSSGAAVSATSATNTFTVDTVAPLVLLNSPAGGSGGTTHSTPIPFEVSTNESVTGLASNIIVTNGVVTSGPTGSGFGPYAFTVTPTTPGTVTTVTLAAGAFRDRAGNPSAAAAPYSLTYVAGYTATPVLVTPGSLAGLYAPHTFTGTAPAGSTVTVYVTPVVTGGTLRSLGTTTATSSGTFSFTPGSPLATGDYNAYVTAQSSGLLVSSNSNTNRFTAINQAVYAGNTTVQASTDPVIQGSVDQVILRVAISVTGGNNIIDPRLTLQSFTFTTGGTTSPADITAARLYYSGSGSFNTISGVSAVANPNGSFTMTCSGIGTSLGPGTYYYYLTYNVAPTATAGNVLDATLTSVTISGQTYAATVPDPVGSRPIVQASRVAGTALRFAGSSTPGVVDFSADATHPAPALNSSYSQTAWVKPAIGTGNATYYVLGNGIGTAAAPYLYVTGDGRLGAGFGTGTGAVSQQTGANVVAANQWHHVAATCDGVSLKIYLNGDLVASTTTTRFPVNTRVNFVGGVGTAGANFFPGDIDEVSQWQRSLSQSEIRQLRHLTLRGTESGLVSYLQFNESGASATDLVSNSVGTLTGATRPTSTAPVGYGTSSLVSITGAGSYTFTGTNVAIKFGTAGATPYDVVVSRLDGLPLGTQPSALGLKKIYTPAYWIVDRYSTSAFTADVTYTLSATDISPADAAAFAITLRLFKRGSNEDGAFEVIAANAANAAAGTVTFPVTSFSQTVIGTLGTSPLPVELVQFTAEQEGSAALLRWTTAQELNSDYFAVEASDDGSTFHQAGTVASQSTASQRTNYQFRDPKLLAYGTKLVYYRLRQVDRDGQTGYSPVRTVAVESTVLALYPNPTTGAAMLTGALPGTMVRVYDALGRQVLVTSADATGTAALVLPRGLATGVYVVRVGSKALRLTVE